MGTRNLSSRFKVFKENKMNKKSHIERILEKAEQRGDKEKAQYWLNKAEKLEEFFNKQKEIKQ